MCNKNLKEFMSKFLEIAQEFAEENNFEIAYGYANEKSSEFIKNKSPLSESIIYYIIDPTREDYSRKLHLRFYENVSVKFYCGNPMFSITLDENLKKLNSDKFDTTTEDFKKIENSDVDNNSKLKKYLKYMWSWC